MPAAWAAVTPDEVWAFGQDIDGQLGNGTVGNVSGTDTPVQVEGVNGAGTLSNVTALAAGDAQSLALLSNGTVAAWGAGGMGELGDGTMTSSDVPVQVEGPAGPALSNVTAISAGQLHSLALVRGFVYAWGSDSFGQLGDGGSSPEDVPVNVAAVGGTMNGDLTGVSAISAGADFSLALVSGGGVDAWGLGNEGQLGDNLSPASSSTPVQVDGLNDAASTLSGATAIAAGEAQGLALLSNGTVCAWGANDMGELGDGSTSSSDVPTTVVGVNGSGELSGVTAIAAGATHSMALLSNGTVDTWGSDMFGQLGDGAAGGHSPDPVPVPGLTNVVAIAATENSSYALESDGTLWAWGSNMSGQLGDGMSTPTFSDVPVQVAELGNGVDTKRRRPPGAGRGAAASSSQMLVWRPGGVDAATSVAFGTPAQNTIGPAKQLTLTNTGAPGLVVSNVDNSGTDPDDFIKSNDGCAGVTLAHGRAARSTSRFAPSMASGNAESATMTISSNALGTSPQVVLTGTAGALPQGPQGPQGPPGRRARSSS